MIVQALWEFKSPLLQLPHVKEEHLKYFINKKRYVKTIQQLVQMKAEDRRNVLRFLNDDEYEDVMKVVGKMPLIDLQVKSEVIDDEASTVYTAGAIVTVTVTLVRKDMSTLLGDETVKEKHCTDEPEEEDVKQGEGEPKEQPKKQPVWQKQRKAGKKSNKKTQAKKHQHSDNKAQNQTNVKKAEEKTQEKVVEKQPPVSVKKPLAGGGDGDGSSGVEESDVSDYEQDKSDDEDSGGDKKGSAFEDDDDWEKFQTGLRKREKILEGKSKISHTVHCPYFPEEKQEYWWVYISDRKSRTLLTSPCHVTALVDKEEVQLRFTAPRWPGLYSFTVCLRSDSYLGFDQTQELKLDVKEAPEVPLEHPQWDMSGEEEDGRPDGDASDASEFATDEDIDSEHDQE